MKIDTKNVSYDEQLLKEAEFKTVFCDNWSIAKAALLKVQEAIKNPIVKFIFGIVIDAAQSTYDKTCGGQS